MYIDEYEHLIYTDNPSLIEWMVLDAIKQGEVLSAQPFIFRGHFCQLMTEGERMYDYKLLSVRTPSEFDEELRRLKHQGYERSFEPVDWNGMLCQWMAKVKTEWMEKERGSIALAAGVPSGTFSTPTASLRLVEGVQVLGGLSSANFLPGRF